jgi:hypothetical protein
MELDHEHSYIFCMKYFCLSRITYMLMVHNFEVLSYKCNAVHITTGVNSMRNGSLYSVILSLNF